MASFVTPAWAPGSSICFRTLDFVANAVGELTLTGASSPLRMMPEGTTNEAVSQTELSTERLAPEIDTEQLWRALDMSLGYSPSQGDLRRALFAVVNIQGQLAGGKPPSPQLLDERCKARYPHGLANAAATAQNHAHEHGL